MTLQDLTRLVTLGEGAYLEFKRKVPRPERMAKEVLAFANTHGGRVLIGVADDGTIHGVRDAAEEEYALRTALHAHCSPDVDVTMKRVPVTHKRDVILVLVPESTTKPHYLTDNGDEPVAYVRVGDMSVEASPEALRLMEAERTEEGVTFEFGDTELILMRYLEDYGRITVKQFANLARIPRPHASQTLVLLARANVLRLHAGPRHDYFTLAYDGAA